MDLALNNLQGWYAIKPNKPNKRNEKENDRKDKVLHIFSTICWNLSERVSG